jgi:hypothetical protein
MIPEAVFREFPAKTLRKLTVSSWKWPENARNPVQGSGDRIQLPVLTGSGRNRINPVTGSVHRNTASMKSADPTGSLADCSIWIFHCNKKGTLSVIEYPLIETDY